MSNWHPKLTAAGQILAIVFEGSAVASRPARLCGDCLDDAMGNDPDIEKKANRLTHRDMDVLKWKCDGRGCYSRARFSVDPEHYETARKLNPIKELLK